MLLASSLSSNFFNIAYSVSYFYYFFHLTPYSPVIYLPLLRILPPLPFSFFFIPSLFSTFYPYLYLPHSQLFHFFLTTFLTSSPSFYAISVPHSFYTCRVRKTAYFKITTRHVKGRLATISPDAGEDADPCCPFSLHLPLELRSGELIYCPLGC